MRIPNTLAKLPISLKPEGRNDLVRIGSANDGGYVVAASLLETVNSMLSFGLSYNIDFEMGWLRINPDIVIHGYDHTVNLRKFRRKFFKSVLTYFYRPVRRRMYLRAYSHYRSVFHSRPERRHFESMIAGSGGSGMATLTEAIAHLPADREGLMLKCDIEGSEYEIADELIANADRFLGIAIEFHACSSRSAEFERVVDALRKTHNLDHIHANNHAGCDAAGYPDVLEVSFSRRDLPPPPIRSDTQLFDGLTLTKLGGELDAPCSPESPELMIEFVGPDTGERTTHTGIDA